MSTPVADDLEKLRPTLEAGLAWLYDIEQPEDALLQHHGVALPAVGNRWLKFCPQGWAGRPVIVIDVAHVQWGSPYEPPKNPLAHGELHQLASMISRSPIARTWNGHPGITGSIAWRAWRIRPSSAIAPTAPSITAFSAAKSTAATGIATATPGSSRQEIRMQRRHHDSGRGAQ